jgi:hypothetical protein
MVKVMYGSARKGGSVHIQQLGQIKKYKDMHILWILSDLSSSIDVTVFDHTVFYTLWEN